jgi:hypothetical protein
MDRHDVGYAEQPADDPRGEVCLLPVAVHEIGPFAAAEGEQALKSARQRSITDRSAENHGIGTVMVRVPGAWMQGFNMAIHP